MADQDTTRAETAAPDTQCTALTVAGSRCRQQAMAEDGMCIWHSPLLEAEADAARQRGQESRRKPVLSLDDLEPALRESPDLELTLENLTRYLGWCTRQCAGGRMDPERLRSIVQAVNALRTALTAKQLAAEVRAANREIRRLKRELAAREKTKEAWQR